MAESLRAAVVQFEHAPGDKPANFAKIEDFVEKAAKSGVKLIAFPECCITGYWFLTKRTKAELLELAEMVPTGPATARLQGLARRKGIVIGAGLLERDEAGKMWNTYIVAMPNGRVHKHRKLQAFEHPDISSGDQYTVFDLPDGTRVGILICYDNNIVENVRITALMGAQVLLAPHQTGGCKSASPHGMKAIDQRLWLEREEKPEAMKAEINGPNGKGWLMRWLPSRAHDNGMFLLFSNGIGIDDDEVRTGNAMILDPYGRTVAETDAAADDMVIGDLDLTLIPMSTGRRWMRARRPELYTPLTMPTGEEQNTRLVRFSSTPLLTSKPLKPSVAP